MRPWLRTRRVWSPLVAAVACAAALLALEDSFVSMPVALGTDGMAVWTMFLPLVWAVAVADTFASKTQAAEARPSQRALLLDVGLLIVLAVVGAALFGTLVGPHQSAVAAVGHVLLMTGVACAVTLRGGSGAGVLTAVALMIGTTFYGIDAPAGRYVRVFQPDGDPAWTWTVGTFSCLVAGALILGDGARVRLAQSHRASG